MTAGEFRNGSADGRAALFDPGKSTRADLRALGRSLRQAVPRRLHGKWSAPSDRPDPVAILRSQEAIRVSELVPIRYGRMLVSPFTFFRGSAAMMAADLSGTPDIGVNVQACGDAHVGNFGVYATAERRLVFDVNDFDETLPAPWEYDLKRLVTSLVLDVRDAGWGDEVARDAAMIAAGRYRDVLARLAEATTLEIQYALMDEERYFRQDLEPKVAKRARRVLSKARKRTNRQAARKWVRLVDGSPRFIDEPPLITRVPPRRSKTSFTP